MHFVLSAAVALCTFASDTPYSEWRAVTIEEALREASMGEPLTAEQISQLAASSPPMPFPDPHQGIRLPDGSLWLASPAGVMLLAPQETRWKLFHSRRWLPPGNVQSISIPVAGTVVVKCTGGSGQLVAVSTNLHEKIEHVHAMLRKYHLRRGLSSQIALRESGNLSTAVMQGSDDNDGAAILLPYWLGRFHRRIE